MPGPIAAGEWRVVVGKALIASWPARYHLEVILRNAPTLRPQPERAPYVPVPALRRGRRYYAGDLHVHWRESTDARPELLAIARFARGRGLDFVEISDHDSVTQLDYFAAAQAQSPELLLVPGIEVTTYAGHANAIFATRFIEHKLGQPGVTIDGIAAAVRAQGALLAINHPATTRRPPGDHPATARGSISVRRAWAAPGGSRSIPPRWPRSSSAPAARARMRQSQEDRWRVEVLIDKVPRTVTSPLYVRYDPSGPDVLGVERAAPVPACEAAPAAAPAPGAGGPIAAFGLLAFGLLALAGWATRRRARGRSWPRAAPG